MHEGRAVPARVGRRLAGAALVLCRSWLRDPGNVRFDPALLESLEDLPAATGAHTVLENWEMMGF